MRRALATFVAFVTVAGCGGGVSKAPPTTLPPPPTTHAPDTVPALSNLMIQGVSPGVEQPPFYAQTTVTRIACGPVPGGVFVAFFVPPIATSNAFGKTTVVIIVNGRAELKDLAGKVLFQDAEPTIKASRHGSIVVSMESITFIGGDRRSVPQGGFNVEGDYQCPATNTPFPGL